MQSRLNVRPDSSAMRQVDGFVATLVSEQGIAADEASRILILLEELLTNLMKYGYPDRSDPGEVEIVLARNGNRLQIEFIDDGGAFDPFAGLASNLDGSSETRPIGGLGLRILRSLADEARYERRNERNAIRLSRFLASVNLP